MGPNMNPPSPSEYDNADRPYGDPVLTEPEPLEVAPLGEVSDLARNLGGLEGSDRIILIGSPGWHGMGNVIERDKAPTVRAAMHAVLPWEVEMFPAQWADPGLGKMQSAPGQVVVRVDPNAVLDPKFPDIRGAVRSPLAVVGRTFVPLLNRDFIDLCAAADGVDGAKLETCGSLRGGAKVFATLRVGTYDVGGGETEQYLALLNGHDGTRALRVFLTTVRIVCENTETHAEEKARGMGVTGLHRAGIAEAAADLRAELSVSIRNFDKVREQDASLIRATVRNVGELGGFYRLAWEAYTGKAYPDSHGLTAGSQRAADNAAAARSAWWEEFESERAGPGGTWYAALQSVTRWADHGGRRVLDATADRMFGAGADFKAAARKLALRAALGSDLESDPATPDLES